MNNSTALMTMQTDDPDLIQRQIDHTRAQMAGTLNEISERLSPDNLIQQAKDSAKEATVGKIKDVRNMANRKVDGMSSNLSQTIRDNPLPVAVIGLGLGWLLISDRNKRDDYRSDNYDYRYGGYRYYTDDANGGNGGRIDKARQRVNEGMREGMSTMEHRASEVKSRVGEAAQNVGETISDAAQRAGEAISDTASRIGDTVDETTGTIQHRAGDAAMRTREEAERLRHEAQWRSRMAMDQTRETFRTTLDQNPLALGAVLAAAGAIIGAAIPTTEAENRLMGETRDRLLGEAKDRAVDVVERVQTVVEDTQHAAMSEVKSSAKRQNLTTGDNMGGGTGN